MNIQKIHNSPNFSSRNKKIDCIIIHYTEMGRASALERLCNVESKVSAHYFIQEDGELYQLVEDTNKAYHAGVSSWKGEEALNENSIGIELDNDGLSIFTTEQMNVCMQLCKMLMRKYNINKHHILGHSDIAPNRKIDPGIFFNWHLLAQEGIGIYHTIPQEELSASIKPLYQFKDKGQKIVGLQEKLNLFGYKLDITGEFDRQTNDVIRAFQSHFFPQKILCQGLKFYRNLESIYNWDVASDLILNSLLTSN